MRADLLGVFENFLHPGMQKAAQLRVDSLGAFPGLLELPENIGLALDLALEPAGDPKKEGVGLDAREKLGAFGLAGFFERGLIADPELAQAGVQMKSTGDRTCVNHRGSRTFPQVDNAQKL